MSGMFIINEEDDLLIDAINELQTAYDIAYFALHVCNKYAEYAQSA